MSQIQDERWVFLCGMPEEFSKITSVFPNQQVLSGADKLNLPALVPTDCKRIVVSGLFGGLAQGIIVGDVCLASTIVDKAGSHFSCDARFNSEAITAGNNASLQQFQAVPWYSSGLLDEADASSQRAAIYQKYGARAIDDEARYAVALAQARPGLKVNDIRACSDDWTETLPLAATGAILNADGSVNIGYLLKAMANEPWAQNLDLFKIASNFIDSLNALEKALIAIDSAFS